MYKLLVMKEKHGTHYANAASLDAFLIACLSCLQRRKEMGWVYQPSLNKEEDAIINLVDLAINTKDYYLARHILAARQRHEYEGFEIESFEAPLGVQDVHKRKKMEPSFSFEDARQFLTKKLHELNLGIMSEATRTFRNITDDVIQIGSKKFAPKDSGGLDVRAVPSNFVPEAEDHEGLERVSTPVEQLDLWLIDSINCLDEEDMVFSFFRRGAKKAHIIHVYMEDNTLKFINIANLMNVYGQTIFQ